LLLGGQLEVRHGSHVLATLTPGRIVGEMAFFRGGKRGASMIGISAGTVAAVQFGSMPRLFEKSATTATTLVRAMEGLTVPAGVRTWVRSAPWRPRRDSRPQSPGISRSKVISDGEPRRLGGPQ
jgi:hypothetical protein